MLRLCILSLGALLACGNGAPSSSTTSSIDGDAMAPCVLATEAYERCRRQVPAPETIAAARVGSTRRSLVVHGAAGKNAMERAQTGAACEESQKQMRAACP